MIRTAGFLVLLVGLGVAVYLGATVFRPPGPRAFPFPVEANLDCQETLDTARRYIPTRECRAWLRSIAAYYNERVMSWEAGDARRTLAELNR